MNKILKNFFVCLFLLTICSCSGGFHPGIFLGNRIRDAKIALNNLADPPAKEAEKPEQVLMTEKEGVESVEEKPIGEVFKSSAPNSKVFIKAGTSKIKYAVVEGEKKKNR